MEQSDDKTSDAREFDPNYEASPENHNDSDESAFARDNVEDSSGKWRRWKRSIFSPSHIFKYPRAEAAQ
jgi:hypothetical protein